MTSSPGETNKKERSLKT